MPIRKIQIIGWEEKGPHVTIGMRFRGTQQERGPFARRESTKKENERQKRRALSAEKGAGPYYRGGKCRKTTTSNESLLNKISEGRRRDKTLLNDGGGKSYRLGRIRSEGRKNPTDRAQPHK